METDFNYIYYDKKYEAAVRNLKATFFDIVSQAETTINILEARIQQEQDTEVQNKLLALWTEQNEILDRNVNQLNALADSVRDMDAFTRKLDAIDKEIYDKIINTLNENTKGQVINNQEMNVENINDNQNVNQVVDVPSKVEENKEEVISVNENTPTEVVTQQEVVPQEEATLPFENTEIIQNNVQDEQVVQQEQIPQQETIDNTVNNDLPFDTSEVTQALEQQEVQEVPGEVISYEEQAPIENTLPFENTEPNIVEEQENIQQVSPNVEENNVVENINQTEVNTVENTQPTEITETIENAQTIENTQPAENVQPTIEPIAQEEMVEEPVLQPIVEENSEPTLQATENTPQIINEIDTDIFQMNEEVPLPQNSTSIEVPEDKEVVEMPVVNQEADGMDLPNVIEANTIEMPQKDEAQAPLVNENILEGLMPTPSGQEVTPEVTEDTYLQNSPLAPTVNVVDDASVKSFVVAPVNEENTMQNQAIEEVQAENTQNTVESTLQLTRILKDEEADAKAIIVNKDQYDKLKNSLDEQEKLLYTSGILNEDVIKQSNYMMDAIISQNATNTDTISEEAEVPSLERMLEQANQLYKAGQTEEAQRIYDQVSEINKSMNAVYDDTNTYENVSEGKTLVKAA